VTWSKSDRLAGAILLPRAQLPLHIFEPRYRDMVRDALAGQGRIGMIQPRFGEIQGEMSEPVELFQAGCLGEIVAAEELDLDRDREVLVLRHRLGPLTVDHHAAVPEGPLGRALHLLAGEAVLERNVRAAGVCGGGESRSGDPLRR